MLPACAALWPEGGWLECRVQVLSKTEGAHDSSAWLCHQPTPCCCMHHQEAGQAGPGVQLSTRQRCMAVQMRPYLCRVNKTRPSKSAACDAA